MKRYLLLFLTIVLIPVLAITQVSVTFTVNLNGYSEFNPAVHRVFMSGARNDATAGFGTLGMWPIPGSEPGFELTETEQSGFFSLTIAGVAPGDYAYKYFLVENDQPTWDLGEWGGDPNRVVEVADQDITFNDIWGIIGDFTLADIVINEILASNTMNQADEDGDFEDWIEIHNRGTAMVNLAGFALSDNPADNMKWVFPLVLINPGEYLVVFASDKNRSEPGNPLHTNFKISAEGEPVVLTNPAGEIIDQVPEVIHSADLSYGRMPDATGEFFYLSQPTPWDVNQGESFQTLLQPLEFSHTEGFYSSSFDLTITTPDEGATIRYTTDGSVPTESSNVFTEPVLIESRLGEENTISMIPTNNNSEPGPPYYEGWQPPLGDVFKINVIRARAFHPNAPLGEVFTQSYMVDNNATNRYTLPVFSIATNNENLFDDEIGIYVEGNYSNYFQDNWERPAHITLFSPTGELQFKEGVGIQLNGNTTRSRPRKSIRIIARDEYGSSWINYQLFPDKEVDKFKRFILRNSGNDWDFAVFRDGLSQYLAKDMKVETQYYQPSILFINGEYWGIHNIRDKYDEHYIMTHYGIEEDEMTILSDNAIHRWGNAAGEAHYNNLTNYINSNNLSNTSSYNYVTERMDMESFIDFQLIHIFVKNTDWPGNNAIFWRYNNDVFAPDQGVRDGRWRWIILDTDFGFDLPIFYVPGLDDGPSHNTLAYATDPNGPSWPNPSWATLMLRKLLDNNDFRVQFINRYCDLLNTTFSQSHVINTIDSLSGLISPEMPEHINRWRRPTSVSEWNENVQDLRTFASQRPDYQRQHMKEKFGLADPVTLTVDVSNPAHGLVKINTIEISGETMGVASNPYPWAGLYFPNIPIELTATPLPGYQFSHWSGGASGSSTTTTITLSGNMQVSAHFTQSPDQLIHFWVFDNTLDNDTPLQSIDATYTFMGEARIDYHSALAGYPFDSGNPNWRKASMERRNNPTPINYMPQGNSGVAYADAEMRGLQIKQPFTGDGGENTLVFSMPTQGFQDVKFRFAAVDEGATDNLIVDYSTSNPENWITTGMSTTEFPLEADYQLYEIDFTNMEAADDNPNLKVRIRFSGADLTIDEGDRTTFNNFSLSGFGFTSIDQPYNKGTGQLVLYPNPATNRIHIADFGQYTGIRIFDLTGRQVAEVSDTSIIDISGLMAGLYTVQAYHVSGKVLMGKFVKNH